MRVRKRRVTLTIALFLIGGLVYFIWPLSFNDSFEYISIGYMEHDIDINSKPTVNSEEFYFSSQDLEFQQIKDVLKRYTFHRVPTMPFNEAAIHWEGIGETFSLGLSNGDFISITKSPYILYCSQVYRVGYWGNSKVVALIDELKEALSLD